MTGQTDQDTATLEGVTVAVITTLYKADNLSFLDLALASLETQNGLRRDQIRIYLCCDGPLPKEHETWLSQNAWRFHLVVRNEENIGLAKSLNRLIERLEDEDFVFRMDGDDICHPDRFRTQIAYMQAHATLDLIGCQAWDIDETGAVTGERDFPIDQTSVETVVVKMNPILHPAYCMRRAMLRIPSIRYPEAYLTEDLGFLVRALEAGMHVGNCPDRLLSWRLGPNFYARRTSLRRGLAELKWYSRAVRSQRGLASPAYFYAIARALIRMMPSSLQARLYGSGLRKSALSKAASSETAA